MTITQVIVRKVFEEGTLKAVVSVIFDNMFAVHDIKVVTSQDKSFVVMPSKRLPNGEFKDIAHPINSEARQLIDAAVLEAYEKCKEQGHGRLFAEEKDSSELMSDLEQFVKEN